MRHPWLAILPVVAAFGLGCASDRYQVSDGAQGRRSIRVLDYRIEPRFESEVADPYVLYTDQAGEYQRHWVSRRFRSELERYAREKSGDSGGRAAELLVTLEALKTTYQRLGGEAPLPRPYAGTCGAVSVAAGPSAPLRVPPTSFRVADGGGFDGHGGLPGNVPLEIDRTAVMTLTAEIRVGATTLHKETFSVEASEIIEHKDFGPWAFSFSNLLGVVTQKALARIDEMVDAALAR